MYEAHGNTEEEGINSILYAYGGEDGGAYVGREG